MVRTHPTATAIKDSCDTCSRFCKKEKNIFFRFIFTTHLWHGAVRLNRISSQVVLRNDFNVYLAYYKTIVIYFYTKCSPKIHQMLYIISFCKLKFKFS